MAKLRELDELHAAAQRAVLALGLCSSAPARGTATGSTSQRPTSSAPPHVDDLPTFYAGRFNACGENVAELERVLEQARLELSHLKARPDGDVKTESLAELEARIVERGETFSTIECAVAVRSSQAIVRRARLKAGRDAEWGRRLAPEIVNGRPLNFARGLVEAGYSLRVAATLSGIPRSTLHEHLNPR